MRSEVRGVSRPEHCLTTTLPWGENTLSLDSGGKNFLGTGVTGSRREHDVTVSPTAT